jgi:hypothetical protein
MVNASIKVAASGYGYITNAGIFVEVYEAAWCNGRPVGINGGISFFFFLIWSVEL